MAVAKSSPSEKDSFLSRPIAGIVRYRFPNNLEMSFELQFPKGTSKFVSETYTATIDPTERVLGLSEMITPQPLHHVTVDLEKDIVVISFPPRALGLRSTKEDEWVTLPFIFYGTKIHIYLSAAMCLFDMRPPPHPGRPGSFTPEYPAMRTAESFPGFPARTFDQPEAGIRDVRDLSALTRLRDSINMEVEKHQGRIQCAIESGKLELYQVQAQKLM